MCSSEPWDSHVQPLAFTQSSEADRQLRLVWVRLNGRGGLPGTSIGETLGGALPPQEVRNAVVGAGRNRDDFLIL